LSTSWLRRMVTSQRRQDHINFILHQRLNPIRHI
jgi:hypothetical protein